MSAKLIDGRALASAIRLDIAKKIKTLSYSPGLAVILVGHDPASVLYVNLKERACAEVGIRFERHAFDSLTQKELLEKISVLNNRTDIDAILVQFPLPFPLSEDGVIEAINPKKDVDGFHPKNIANLVTATPVIIPGLAEGIMALISSTGTSLVGLHAIVLTNSTIFALPVSYLLKTAGVEVSTLLNPKLANTTPSIAKADIIITALGKPQVIIGSMIKKGAIVIDVGTNLLPNGKTVGDVDPITVLSQAGWLSPVPGGVGPMTVAMLLKNVLHCAAARRHKA